MKTEKHKKIFKNYEKAKSKKMEKMANKMLKKDERNNRLKERIIDDKFLKNF